MNYLDKYKNSVIKIAELIDWVKVRNVIEILSKLRNSSGRLFILGLGGSGANASHMVNDLRKICAIDAYSPLDNFSGFSASCNDEGMGNYFPRWLETSRISKNDAIFILSVGGGNKDKNVSLDLVNAISCAKKNGSQILGIVGRDGGETLKSSTEVILIPSISESLDTALVESFQAIIWHSMVFHPTLKRNQSKWESVMEINEK